ncbi:37S ribosomal protein S16, mitochondrial [Hypocenomyce scalaris]|nr:37S ribosomal protein S16, mitochondrial [Hypocenomyce scalaris]
MEVLGTYDPIPKLALQGEGKPYKDIKLDIARAKYWLGVGAQPSDPAWRLLSMLGLLEPRYPKQQPQQQRSPATDESFTSSQAVSALEGR